MSNSNSQIIDKMNNLLPVPGVILNASEAVTTTCRLHIILSKHNIAELAAEGKINAREAVLVARQLHIMFSKHNLAELAEGKINAREAVLVARQLGVMLTKHNIAELDGEPVAQDGEPVAQDGEPVGQDGDIEHDRPWKRWVANYIAKLCFCDFYTRRMGKRKSKYMFVGTEVNRTFAVKIFKMIYTTLEHEARTESREELGKYSYSFVTSVLNGASGTIVDRCERLIKSAKDGNIKDEEGETLPIMSSIYRRHASQVESWMDKNLDIELEPEPAKRDEGKRVLSND